MKKLLCLAVFFSASLLQAEAQQQTPKKPLSHDVYDSWNSLEGDKISNNGQFVLYNIDPQEGDGDLYIRSMVNNAAAKYNRGTKARFTNDSQFAVFQIKPEHQKVRALKLKKKKGDDLPKDSLAIVKLVDMSVVKMPRVKSYKLPKEGSGWLAYHLEKPLAEKKEAKKDTAAVSEKKVETKKSTPKKNKDAKGTELVLRNLNTGQEHRFSRVVDYIFSEQGNMLYFVKDELDSLHHAGVFAFSTSELKEMPIDTGKVTYKGITTDKTGNQLAYVASADTVGADIRYFGLNYWNTKNRRNQLLADTAAKGLPQKWMVSEHGNLTFSEDGKRLFFGTFPRPVRYEKDTTQLDEDKVSLDIWTYKDPLIQPMQLKQNDQELKRSFLAMYDLKSGKMQQLATLEMPDVYLDAYKTGDVALAVSDEKYKITIGYDTPTRKDAYLIDLKKGTAKQVLKETRGNPRLSPMGKYVYWYEPMDSSWHALSARGGANINLTKKLAVPFYDVDFDMPMLPDDYGFAGWVEDDSYLLVYDQHDIWKLDPTGKKAAVNLTDSYGRQNNLRLRYEKLDPEEKFIPANADLYLSGFNIRTKADGYYKDYVSKEAKPEKLISSDHAYTSLSKAKDEQLVTFRRGDFRNYNDLYTSNLGFANVEKLTDANPQAAAYKWGTVELMDWKSTDGVPLQGLLYKPENFDPKKKYPMMVYFYERSSDRMHAHRTPAPSASTINIPLFVSNDYLVFVPDIVYKDGYPGESAMDCIIPGVQLLVQQGFVDDKNMALQGQSWGGYQIAYMVTRTNLFKAAMAGAPVSNMTSAYGGIRWGTGLSRQFQYERTQSRIGGTLWEKPLQFIENSPLFFADRVETPLLIMHNDNDGAVPWYQGIEYFMALRRLNKPVWMLVYNGEDHNLMQRKNRKDLSVRMSQFFDHYLKGAPAPVWMQQGVPSVIKGKNFGLELVSEPEVAGELQE
ncbi:alpha/beta hydrolase family protein [Pontibacter anaerobius]|uniref:Prolyl oligopeptidase family serine peptidase n=1 Tax=Pontibacter anaerobius TaxID=2993940 RepID=A0ABT3RDA8_9BACT|nr:prolyl oligopeptidase family serine peptidase [Pontibacter anaerobius]MCX2739829.1 prolyl oligopeptidase family serine peptidase [Pontibacter anaerobius]